MQNRMRITLLFLALVTLLPLICAGTLYGVATPGGRKLDVFKIDPQVGKVTANVTSLRLVNAIGTCDTLLLSYDNRTQELGLSCDDELYFVEVWWNWRIGTVTKEDTWGIESIATIVPAWDDSFGGNCALILLPTASLQKDANMASLTCFSMGTQSTINIAHGSYPWIKSSQPFVLSSTGKQIGIFNFISDNDVLIWGQSIVDNSSNLIRMDTRSITVEPWYSFTKLNVPTDLLYGSTSYANRIMGDIVVIELNTGVFVLDLTTKSMSSVFSFCRGHAKIGSSAFDPVNALMYSIVSCFDGPILVTFDIKNRAVKNSVKFDESSLYIKGLFYTL